MHLAFVLSLIAVTLNLSTAIAQFAISRAPGWRAARAFGFIALTATCYSLGTLVSSTGGLPDAIYLAASRWGYAWANLHVLAWFPFAFGGPDAELRRVPRALRLVMASNLAATCTLAITGWHLTADVYRVAVPWAGVVYHNSVTTSLGELYGFTTIGLLAIPFIQFIRRMWEGERASGIVVAGFAVFYASSVIEVLVANGQLVWLSPADIGFLAVVIPTSWRMLGRFISDARQLSELSSRLEVEVRERTQERDRAETALLESERLAALGRLAGGVGHEINNPLTYLQLSLACVDEHLQASGSPAPVKEALANASDGALRIQKVVEGLRTYSRREEVLGPLDPRDAVRAALKVAGPHLRQIADVELQIPSTPLVLADEPRLVQALVNLLVNAAQAMRSSGVGGRIIVRTRALSPTEVAIEVEDDGPGIPEEHLPRLMEPYFTTRAAEGGSGLGLFVTRGIMEAHGGSLEFAAPGQRGVCARLVLKRYAGRQQAVPSVAGPDRSPAAIAETVQSRSAVAGSRARVLLVDDEPLVLHMLARALKPRWDVTCVEDGEQALSRLAQTRYDLIVCDLMMPGLSGMALADQVERTDPALRRRMVFLTGGAVTEEAQSFLSRPGVAHLMKPFDLVSLDALLQDVIAGP